MKTVSDHPPATDLRCLVEPAAPTDVELEANAGAGLAFDMGVLLAGRDCRDALQRVCGWHLTRGAKGLVCTPRGEPEPVPNLAPN